MPGTLLPARMEAPSKCCLRDYVPGANRKDRMKKVVMIMVSWTEIKTALIAQGLLGESDWPKEVHKINMEWGDDGGMKWEVDLQDPLANEVNASRLINGKKGQS